MHRTLRLALGLAALGIVGCATNKPEEKLREAADLAGQRLGQAPAWTLDWDTSPPEWTAGPVVTRDEAVGLALRNNRMLRAELELIGQADAELLQAGLMKNPVVNFMFMFPDGGGTAMFRGAGLPMQPLQDLWMIPARKKVAAAALQQAVLRVANQAVQTATEVRTLYARLQYAQRALALVQDNMQLAEQTMRLVEVRQAAGQTSQVSANLARIRLRRLESERRALESEYRMLQRDMLLIVGFAAAPDGWTVTPIHEMNDALAAAGDEPELLALGADQRLDLKAAEWASQAAAERVALERRAAWPEVGIGLSAERAGAPKTSRPLTVPARVGNAAAQWLTNKVYGVQSMPTAPTIAPWQRKTYNMDWTLGPMLELEIPIFDQNQAQIARAMHEHNQKWAEYEARLQEMTRDVRSALVKQRTALEQVEYARAAILPEVISNLELAQQAFVAGQESLTVYLQAQEDVIMTRRMILDYLRDYYVSRAELERAVGGRLTRSDEPRDSVSTAEAPKE